MKKHTTPGGVFPATWSFHAAAAKVGGRFATDFFVATFNQLEPQQSPIYQRKSSSKPSIMMFNMFFNFLNQW